MQDTIGLVIAMVGWLSFLLPLLRSRSDIEHPWVLGALGAVGAGVTAWSIATDTGYWWVLGTGVLAGVQVAAALSVIRTARLGNEAVDAGRA